MLGYVLLPLILLLKWCYGMQPTVDFLLLEILVELWDATNTLVDFVSLEILVEIADLVGPSRNETKSGPACSFNIYFRIN